MKNRTTKNLPKLALMIGCLSFCGDLNAGLIFDVVDHYELIRPDGTLGDPLDKGFSVSGTITVTMTGFWGRDQDGDFIRSDPDFGIIKDNPFEDWNITVQVDDTDDLIPDRTFVFNKANSSWSPAQTGNEVLLPVLQITEDYIFVPNLFDFAANFNTNTLTLDSTSLDQGLDWISETNRFLFISGVPGTLDPDEINGIYEGGGGDVRVAVRSVVPEPSACIVWSLLGVCGGVLRRRRNA